MGKQYNKLLKRRRRNAYNERCKDKINQILKKKTVSAKKK